jgi:Xaa-Pro aminopeptidase
MTDLNERIAIVSRLQQASSEVFAEISQLLMSGLSEPEIANLISAAFEKRDIVKFWYDVPIIVLVGTERLIHGANTDYATKSPSADVLLEPGSTIYIDVHPQDSETGLWGDWNTMAIFQPRQGLDDEQVAFLAEMREIHRTVISKIQPSWTGAELMESFFQAYEQAGITPMLGEKPDIGHTIHAGLKSESNRVLLNAANTTPIAGHFYAIEPAGTRQAEHGGGQLVGRFEECIYVPEKGEVILLGSQKLVPISI